MNLKAQNFRISVTALLMILGILPFLSAQEKIGKEIHDVYTIKEGTSLSIDNKFGNIDLRNWDKNSVDVDVQIKLYDVSESEAASIINNIKMHAAAIPYPMFRYNDFLWSSRSSRFSNRF